MEALAVFAAAGFSSWVLRIGFINVFPAGKLPERLRGALHVTAPAAMAALLVADLSHIAADGAGSFVTATIATLASAAVMWKTKNLALVAAAGLATYYVGSLVL